MVSNITSTDLQYHVFTYLIDDHRARGLAVERNCS